MSHTAVEVFVGAKSGIERAFCRVIVRVQDVNDNPPVLTRPFYETQVTEEDDRHLPKTIVQVVARDEDVSDRDKLRYFLSGDGVFNPYDEVATRHSHPRPDNRNRGRTTKLMARQKPGDARGSVGGDHTELEVREASEASNEVNLAKDTDGRTTFDTHRKSSVDNNKGAGGWEYPNKSVRGSVIQEDSPVPGNNMSTEFNDHRNYTESNEQSRKIKASRSRNKPGKHRNTASNRRFSGSKTTENKNGIAVPGNHFVINERTGRVQLIKPLDRDAPNGRARWALTVSVSDGAHTSTADLFVNVKDINDNAPFFPTPQLVASVKENSPAGTAVAQVSAVDHDDPNEGDHATLHYTLEKNVIDQQSGHPIFVIEPSTGLMKTALCCLDREQTAVYGVKVVASDGGGLKADQLTLITADQLTLVTADQLTLVTADQLTIVTADQLTLVTADQLTLALHCMVHYIEDDRRVFTTEVKPQLHLRDKQVEVSAFLRAENKVSEVANLVGVFRTTVYTIKKHMDNGEGSNRRAGSGRKSVVDRDSLRDDIQSSPLTSVRQHARRLGAEAATVR
ncbi:Cadherin [Trinorchestia longiramus]|nr:Cadherin [Trinorchestia longiramus]